MNTQGEIWKKPEGARRPGRLTLEVWPGLGERGPPATAPECLGNGI